MKPFYLKKINCATEDSDLMVSDLKQMKNKMVFFMAGLTKI